MPFSADVVILGAGIGGYEAFRTLDTLFRRHGLTKKIIIIDRNNYFTFAPLLHEVASGSVEPTHAALPLRELVYGTAHTFLKTDVLSIDPSNKTVHTSAGEVRYEFCITALGSATNYYGIPGAEQFSYHVRNLEAAIRLRHDLLYRLEHGESKTDIVIVGGGYTGVEVAAQMQQFVMTDIAKLYPEKKLSVTIIQTAPALVPVLPVKAQKIITDRLQRMGVRILLDSKVKEVAKNRVVLSDETSLPSDMTVWCAGFANIADKLLPKEFSLPDCRLPTTNFLNHPMAPTLYAVGDIGHICNPGSDTPVPQLGEAAHAEGRYVAHHIVATLRGKTPGSFVFKSKGQLMPIGDWFGIGIFGTHVVSGRLMWWVRRTVYVTFFPGTLRKLKIILDWTLRIFGFSYIILVESKNNPEGSQH